MRTAIYARVSTSEQSCDMQLSALREYAQARNWQIMGEYVDSGVSGAKASRPALDKLMGDAHKRRFDVLLCWKLDRMGRSLSHLLTLVGTLEKLGIQFVSYTQQIDTTTPQGRFFFQIMGAVSELERELIRERVRAGVAHAKSKGKVLGRPKVEVKLKGSGSLRELAALCGVSKDTIRRRLAAGSVVV